MERKGLSMRMALNVTKDGKPRVLTLENWGGKGYTLVVQYPDGQRVKARKQPHCSGIPSLEVAARENGFEVVK
jgi:hypothetical protein